MSAPKVIRRCETCGNLHRARGLRLKLGPSSAKLVDGHVDYLEEPTR